MLGYRILILAIDHEHEQKFRDEFCMVFVKSSLWSGTQKVSKILKKERLLSRTLDTYSNFCQRS